MHGARYEEFGFFYCIFVRKEERNEIIELLKIQQNLSVSTFQPAEFIDGPYLRETHWRNTWDTEKFSEYLSDEEYEYDFAVPVANYTWERHLDKSLPDGFQCYIPQKWFADELGLSMSENGHQSWLGKNGDLVLQAHKPCDEQKVLVIDENILRSYAEKFDIEPIWLMIAERNTWPNGDNKQFCQQRSEGAAWLEGGGWQQTGWNRDTKR